MALKVADFALPPRCPGCGERVAADHRFCAVCWAGLRFIGPPWCATCHAPFAYDRGEGAVCGACLAMPPRHRGVRAAVAYGPVARQLALKLKYGRRTGVAKTMARLMLRNVKPVDVLVPVPLHRWRLWSRGYNQAALIAMALGRLAGRPVALDALVRSRKTPVLRAMNPRARAQAVRGAFRMVETAAVKGRAVGLIDDIHTSGATVDACTRALLAAGAASVTVMCWARVLPGDAND